MAKYLLLYHGGGMPETEAEMAAVLKAWEAWYSSLGEAVADPGNPIGPEFKSISSAGAVSDGAAGAGPSGYTILEAESLDAAAGMAKGCPVLEGGASISVLETFNAM